MADILSLSTSGIKKTHIMYKANLSYEQILHYLDDLISKELMSTDRADGSILYRTTEKGREFLDCFGRMVQLISETASPAPRVPLIAT